MIAVRRSSVPPTSCGPTWSSTLPMISGIPTHRTNPTSTASGIAVCSPAVTAAPNSPSADDCWACPRPNPRATFRLTIATDSSNSPASHCASARPAVTGTCSAWTRSRLAPSPRCPRTLRDRHPLHQAILVAWPAPSSARPACVPPLAGSPVPGAGAATAASRRSPHPNPLGGPTPLSRTTNGRPSRSQEPAVAKQSP